jgi:hypothetical protein
VWLWWLSTASAGGVHGAEVQPRGTGAVRLEGGMAGALPTVLAGASVGVSERVDLGAHVQTHAGLAWSLGATGRVRLSDHWGVGLTVDESLFTVQELAGIQALRAPLGNRVAATPQLLGAWQTDAGVSVGGSLGAEVGTWRLVEDPDGGAVRALRPALDHVWGEVVASWPRERGGLFVRVRAVVPVAADFHVLGYLPVVAVGRHWGLP